MGYSGTTECIFCYTNGRGCCTVESHIDVCITCFDVKIGPDVLRVAGEMKNFDIAVDCYCRLCRKRKLVGFYIPVCEDCVEESNEE